MLGAEKKKHTWQGGNRILGILESATVTVRTMALGPGACLHILNLPLTRGATLLLCALFPHLKNGLIILTIL